ncbi:MAG: hypothetical protein GF411_15310 [Candidatus Lokiarchaeota archaeon]|nr:hypothetical protein [Candidatus Lokiarchaeota archaeon]
MASKTITISEEVYDLLEKMLLPGEKIEDAILRLCGIKSRLHDSDFEKGLEKIINEDTELLKRLAK